jgi:UDP-2,3-diacylglucosamine hydrolase
MDEPSAYFVSDAHLGTARPGQPELRQQHLVRFLREYASGADRLFIVGDLFDFWIEYDRFIRADYFSSLCQLSELVRGGTRVHYVTGNHDFAIGPFLARELGVVLHDVAFTGTLQGRQVHVQHGDGIVPSDYAYRLLRRFLRNRFNLYLYKLLHPTIGVAIASAASRMSRKRSDGRLTPQRCQRYRREARRILGMGNDVVVLGHTHWPELLIGKDGTYCNTGEWLTGYSFAELRGGQMHLWRFPPGADRPEPIQSVSWK